MVNGQLIIFGQNNSYYVYTPKIYTGSEFKAVNSYIFTNGKWNKCFVYQPSILLDNENNILADNADLILIIDKDQNQYHKLQTPDSENKDMYIYDPVQDNRMYEKNDNIV